MELEMIMTSENEVTNCHILALINEVNFIKSDEVWEAMVSLLSQSTTPAHP